IWLGIPGERRTWLTQLDGIPNILKNIAKYFPKIKVYVDGMTAYDGEKIEVADNLKTFKAIKAEVDKLNLDIDMESLSGYDYRSKICYCSTCDIAISDLATTALTPFVFCKKPGVAFYQEIENHLNYALSLQKNIKFLFVLDKNALLTTNIRNSLSKDFHIPWQHLYNLAAQSLEEIKGVKMHRLDVPPVELVAKQYDLEKELSIKIPIESVALYDKITKQINTLTNNQEMMMDKINIIISNDSEKELGLDNEINLKYNNALQENENLKAQLSKLNQEFEAARQELKSIDNVINSLSAQKQSLEISNLEQDLINKKLKAQILEKELGLDNEINLKYNNALQENENLKAQLSKLNQEFETNNPKSKLENQKLNADLYFALNYGTAKSRIKNQLTYKLGEAMIANSKSIWGYIKMPYILSYIKETHQKNQKLYQEKIKANPSLKLPPLESYPDYNEAIKIKEHLSYKLGEALINADKSKLGYLTLWFKCKKITKEHKNNYKNSPNN
ncbi:coiled-coil domain-containing protein, partial [Campylobacter hyointestinalis]|uniref:coiled-coil domain-containing protein n=1 Tax=Campylobacter hyointestinalis TaxID=198 RepID=UPI000DCCCB29